MIRSCNCTNKYANKNKLALLQIFIQDYSATSNLIIKYIFENGYKNKDNSIFDINKKDLHLDTLPNNDFLKQFNNYNLTQRMMQCIGKQASSIIRSSTEKTRKTKYVVQDLMKQNKNCSKLQQKLDKTKITLPNFNKIYPQLDNRFFDIKDTNNNFDCYIRIKLYDKKSINIPFNKHKKYLEFEGKGRIMNSIRLHDKDISFSFELPEVPKKIDGIKVGADQGILTTLTLSDNQITKPNKDGYDLNKIIRCLNRKKKGSKSFKRCQEHRLNYVNWSINQLNFKNIHTINLEKLYQVRKGKKASKFLSSFTYPLIKKKLVSISETEGFIVNEVDNRFRSQRCSECGWTQKSNRKGKLFVCKICSYATDSDINASLNLLEDNLYVIPEKVRLDNLNIKGFYWSLDNLMNLSKECIVPYVQKI